MRERKWGVYVLETILAIVLCVLVKDTLKPEPAGATAPPAPKPTFTAARRDGTTVDLTPRPGTFRIVHFWATWCPPCEEELPGLLEIHREIQKDPTVELVMVSVDDDWKIVDPWLEKRGGLSLPVVLDPGHKVASSFGTDKYPETYLISANGEVLSHVKGPIDWKDPAVRAQLEALRKRSG